MNKSEEKRWQGEDTRVVVWFSYGAASAVALYLALREYSNVVAVYCDTGGEHPDNVRFLSDVEKWLGIEIVKLKNEKYADHFDVFASDRFLVGPHGARCTVELKKRLRFQFQKADDIQIFGYTSDEPHRAERFNAGYPEVDTDFILVRKGVAKLQCLGVLWREGIKIPAMYDLGYKNNNCIGCVKGGMGYWNKIRKDFPVHFERMAKIEREIGASVLRSEIPKSGRASSPLYLDELDEDRGQFPKAEPIQCDFVCSSL